MATKKTAHAKKAAAKKVAKKKNKPTPASTKNWDVHDTRGMSPEQITDLVTKRSRPVAKKSAVTKKEAIPKKPHGRPTLYSEELATKLCERLAGGESLLTICKSDDMPARSTVMRWLLDDKYPGFRDKYAQARDEQADFYAEQIIAISDEECTMVKHGDGDEEAEVEVVFDATAVARNRLRVDARKWYASKLAPKKYGDKLQVGGAADLPPVQQVHSMSTEALLAIAGGAKKP